MTAAILAPTIDPATELAIRLFAQRIQAKYDVLGFILFGSRVRGEQRPNRDAGIAVLLRGEHERPPPAKLAMADEAFDVLLETGLRIQPLPVGEDQWAKPELFANPRLLGLDRNSGHAGRRNA